ncbi:nucleotidyltransferase [bacterium]|nr:MAG: nucleotidyltransferase [bacterium]
MRTLEEGFAKFKSRLELKPKERQNAIDRHNEIREHLRSKFTIENDFLTGSYARWTKTKPLKDVDIFCPLGTAHSHYRDEHPDNVLKAFEEALAEKYGSANVERQRRSCTVRFGVTPDSEDKTDYKVISVDIVPAFKKGEDYEIPDSIEGKWIETNPKTHADKAVAAQRAYNDQWKAMVRMIKYWNNNRARVTGQDKPIKPSFLLEVMCLDCLSGGFGGRWDYEFESLFATLATRIDQEWADPAGLGPPVSDMMDDSKKQAAKAALLEAKRAARAAINLAAQGKNYEAQLAWRELFGPLFPHP